MGEGGVWGGEGSEGAVSARAWIVGWGSLLTFCGEQDMGCRHIFLDNGAHEMKTQPLRCWTRRSYGYNS